MSSSLIEASSFHFKPLPFISSLSDPLELGEFLSSAMSEAPILDLPELALECIIEKLSPACLCSMACVCRSLKGKCTGDHPWERHMKEKWSGVIGPAGKKEWELHLASPGIVERLKPKSWMESLFFIWPLSLLNSKFDAASKPVNPLRIDSIMSWYLALECGEYWFPAQVYNRENGHYGFSLSCYDAQLRYDRKTDTFTARLPFIGIHHMGKRLLSWRKEYTGTGCELRLSILLHMIFMSLIVCMTCAQEIILKSSGGKTKNSRMAGGMELWVICIHAKKMNVVVAATKMIP
ncbi:F-box protein At2g32560-like isoform X3 [Typha angustifolia]|uniref:F-box protein At2g32560-like isoform X3 n=1 Tax=Typha angustifolia TaxID=59011 RepID=UPI003C2F63A2